MMTRKVFYSEDLWGNNDSTFDDKIKLAIHSHRYSFRNGGNNIRNSECSCDIIGSISNS
jgi:hypothetical protein